MFKKVWNSPTFMTWGNLLAKSSNLIILLPVVLHYFSPEDVVVWYLYFTIVSLQLLIDFGFLPTFTRLFAYAYGGMSLIEMEKTGSHTPANGQPDYEAMKTLLQATKSIYLKIAVVSFFMASIFGSWLAYDPISRSTHPASAWGGWFIVILIASVNIFTNSFIALLQGIDRVALVQRWQMISSLLAVLTASLSIYLFHSLFIGITVFYFWYIVNFFINYILYKKYFSYQGLIDDKKVQQLISKVIWPTAWRSGLGIAASLGIIQLSGMIVAKIAVAPVAASYMLALQMIRAVSSFSQAPFYSRLPYFAKLYTSHAFSELLVNTKKRMITSLGVFIFLYVSITIFAPILLDIIHSNTQFPPFLLWFLMGSAFFLERFGAMYLQLYTLSNHIVWHIANGISGITMILFVLMTYSYLGIYAFPAGMLLAYGFFYVPYVMRKAYKLFSLSFFTQEKDLLIKFGFLFLTLNAILKFIRNSYV